MDKYLNYCVQCRKRFIAEDERMSIFRKDCIICGAEKSIMSASKDDIFHSYITRMMAQFNGRIVSNNDYALQELEKDMDRFKKKPDLMRNTPEGYFNKEFLCRVLSMVWKRDKYAKNLEVLKVLESLVLLLNIDLGYNKYNFEELNNYMPQHESNWDKPRERRWVDP